MSENTETTTVTTSIPLTRIADLLCCGFEGGVGYWCQIVDYNEPEKPRSVWGDDRVYRHVDYPLTGGAVLCVATDDDPDEPETLTLDRAAIDRGLAAMAKDFPRHWGDFIRENEDACTGDVFIQCCLFGEVVYG